jgi:hypothetical protein
MQATWLIDYERITPRSQMLQEFGFFKTIYDMRYFLTFLLVLFLIPVNAQKFTESLGVPNDKGGVVVVNHSSKVDSLINGLITKVVSKQLPTPMIKPSTDTIQLDSLGNPIIKGYLQKEGFRIQIFTGANSRADKDKALRLQRKCNEQFPDMKSYCSFMSPRWVVRVGDFATKEEAMLKMTEVREAGLSHEVRLVRCKVQIPIY